MQDRFLGPWETRRTLAARPLVFFEHPRGT